MNPAPAARPEGQWHAPDVEQLARAFAAVDRLVAGIRPDQWSAPTPCTKWTVDRLVAHLTGMNRVFVALLDEKPPPRPVDGQPDPDPHRSFQDSAAALLAAFDQPGVLDRSFRSPLGAATGSERLQIRMYDLLAHGWDLAQATGQPVALPEDLAEQALAFAHRQISDEARAGRFATAQPVGDHATASERLVAFLGRSVPASH